MQSPTHRSRALIRAAIVLSLGSLGVGLACGGSTAVSIGEQGDGGTPGSVGSGSSSGAATGPSIVGSGSSNAGASGGATSSGGNTPAPAGGGGTFPGQASFDGGVLTITLPDGGSISISAGGITIPLPDGGSITIAIVDGGLELPFGDGGVIIPLPNLPLDGGFTFPGFDGGLTFPGFDGGFTFPGFDGGFSLPAADAGGASCAALSACCASLAANQQRGCTEVAGFGIDQACQAAYTEYKCQ